MNNSPVLKEIIVTADEESLNREIVERARTHVGNLAHALKTPLSVMMNEASARGEDALADKVKEHHFGDLPPAPRSRDRRL